MAGAEDLAVDAELLPQADIQSGRQNDEARGEFFAVRQLDGLPFGAGREISVTLAWMNSVRLGICERTVLTSVS